MHDNVWWMWCTSCLQISDRYIDKDVSPVCLENLEAIDIKQTKNSHAL